jgi:HEAT repeat protein
LDLSEKAARAAMVFGQCGDTSPTALKEIKARFEESRASKQYEAEQIIFGLTYFNLGADNSDEVLSQVLVYCAKGIGHTDLAAASWVLTYENEPRLAHGLIHMLSSSNPEVQKGAASLLGVIGLSAGEATDTIEKLLKTSNDEEVRRSLAMAAGTIFDSSKLDELKRFLRAEKSETIRRSIQHGIDVLEMNMQAW